MAYQSVLKRKETLTPTTTWVTLEDMVLSDINQSQKGTYNVIPLR